MVTVFKNDSNYFSTIYLRFLLLSKIKQFIVFSSIFKCFKILLQTINFFPLFRSFFETIEFQKHRVQFWPTLTDADLFNYIFSKKGFWIPLLSSKKGAIIAVSSSLLGVNLDRFSLSILPPRKVGIPFILFCCIKLVSEVPVLSVLFKILLFFILLLRSYRD